MSYVQHDMNTTGRLAARRAASLQDARQKSQGFVILLRFHAFEDVYKALLTQAALPAVHSAVVQATDLDLAIFALHLST